MLGLCQGLYIIGSHWCTHYSDLKGNVKCLDCYRDIYYRVTMSVHITMTLKVL